MNRITNALYPSHPGSGSEGLATTHHTPGDATASRGVSPSSSSFPSLAVNVGATRSIYDDPRQSRFASPPPTLERSHSEVDAAALKAGTARPHLSRQRSESNHLSAPQDRKGGPSSGTSTPSAFAHTGPDRSLRVNLMSVPGTGARKRSSAGPTLAAGRLSCMAKGPGSRYVVGGGQYLRVLELSRPTDVDGVADPPKPGRQPLCRGPGGVTITEVANLWRGTWGIGKGINDVDWGVGNFETKVVTATPSGHWMIFDAERGKLEVAGGHSRPVNTIRFSKIPAYAHMLFTGGQEGQVRLWDLRAAEPANRKHYKHNAPISAISLCRDDPHQFVVGSEAGNLFRYDSRVPGKAVGKIWGAHGSKPVMDLKWKEGDEYGLSGQGWLATAGGDRTVQIWDMSQSWDKGAMPTHTLHTTYPLRSIDWRPNHPTELVVVPWDLATATASPDSGRPEDAPSVPHESDASLEVWDVRRHYIAKYALPGHDSTAVSAIWDDPDTVVACYQNGGLVQIDLHSRVAPKTLPLESIPRQVVAVSSRDELAYALDRFKLGEVPFDDVKAEYSVHWQVGRHRKGVADPAYEPLQAVGTVPLGGVDEDEFAYMANHYRLEGSEPEKLCLWNRDVASMCHRIDDARAWEFLQGLIEEFGNAGEGMFNESVFTQGANGGTTSAPPRPPSPTGHDERRDSEETVNFGAFPGVPLVRGPDLVGTVGTPEATTSDEGSGPESDGPSTPSNSRFKSFIPPGPNSDVNVRPGNPHLLSSSSGNLLHQSVVRTVGKKLGFETPLTDDGEATPTADMDYPDPYGIAAALEAATGPSTQRTGREAASRSTPHSTRAPTPVGERGAVNGRHSASGSLRGSQRPSITDRAMMERIQPAAISRRVQDAFPLNKWDEYRDTRCKALLDWWQAYIDDGEIQLAAALYVVGSKVVNFPAKQAERVFEAYLEMLEAAHLAVPLAYNRRFAGILNSQTLGGQDGVTHPLYCAKCGKSTGSLEDTAQTKTFWWCTRCRRAAKICSVCREPVTGLWMGCYKCRHGGHHGCMRLYYLEAAQTTVAAPLSSRAPSPSLGGLGMRLQQQQQAQTGALPSAGSQGGLAHSDTPLSRKQVELVVGGSDTGAITESATSAVVSTDVCPTGCGCVCRTAVRH